ncbi:MAG TPA: hypothetical protein VIG45_00150 [Erysipelothrix sp.]
MKSLLVCLLFLNLNQVYFVDRNPSHQKPCYKVIEGPKETLYRYHRSDEKNVFKVLKNNTHKLLPYHFQVLYYKIKIYFTYYIDMLFEYAIGGLV